MASHLKNSNLKPPGFKSSFDKVVDATKPTVEKKVAKQWTPTLCHFFTSEDGCINGDECKFLHVAKEIQVSPSRTCLDCHQVIDKGKRCNACYEKASAMSTAVSVPKKMCKATGCTRKVNDYDYCGPCYREAEKTLCASEDCENRVRNDGDSDYCSECNKAYYKAQRDAVPDVKCATRSCNNKTKYFCGDDENRPSGNKLCTSCRPVIIYR